jgi:hypothetical protein
MSSNNKNTALVMFAVIAAFGIVLGTLTEFAFAKPSRHPLPDQVPDEHNPCGRLAITHDTPICGRS